MRDMETLSEQDVKVKVSTCKCGGVVRTAISHLMDKKSVKEFAYEANELTAALLRIDATNIIHFLPHST